MEMAAVKKTLFLTALLFLLISCSSIQPRKPQFAVVKMVQVIDKKNAAHVGIFIPQIKEKNVRYTFVKDETDIDNPPVIKITIGNVLKPMITICSIICLKGTLNKKIEK